jgi:hypothetical protein
VTVTAVVAGAVSVYTTVDGAGAVVTTAGAGRSTVSVRTEQALAKPATTAANARIERVFMALPPVLEAQRT